MLKMPRVTVFMPAFNVERYIAEAVESVLCQTFRDFELLIIDDGSTDATPEILAAYRHDSRIRIVTHDKNRGRPITRNEGLDLAVGEYIAFLDADDRCAPDRLERQVTYLDAKSDIGGVYSQRRIFCSGDDTAPFVYPEIAPEPDMIACGLLLGCTIQQTALMVRASAMAGYRYDPDFPVAQDYELWSRMIATCRFACLPLPLTHYRRHPAQASTARIEEQDALARKVRARQLAALGVSFDELDLIRHECLLAHNRRAEVLEKTGRPLDIEYVRWAGRWLASLRAGNARIRVYPEPAFSLMLARCWLFACRKAARNGSRALVMREKFRGPMRQAVLAFYLHEAKRKTRKRFRAQDA